MIIVPKVITPPTSEPVTAAEAIYQLKLESDDAEMAFVEGKIKTARQLCERYSGLSFMTQELEIKLDRFPCGEIVLPMGPVQSIDDFVYINSDGDAIDLVEGTDYYKDLSSEPARVRFVSSWPTTKCQLSAVAISYTAGYPSDDHGPTPDTIKEAVLKTTARLYEKRGDGDDGPVLTSEITDLLDTIKVYWNANV